jgi:hypothetical protein
MPGDYDNELRGALFKNDRKREGHEDADYRGSCEIAGVEYWMNGWLKVAKSGAKYLSLTFKAKGERQDRAPWSKTDDDVPF